MLTLSLILSCHLPDLSIMANTYKMIMNGDDMPSAFIDFVTDRLPNTYVRRMDANDSLRTNKDIIGLAEEFNATSEYKVNIQEVQNHWIRESYLDGCEQVCIRVTFPWEGLARALVAGDNEHVLVVALRAGSLLCRRSRGYLPYIGRIDIATVFH